MKSFDIMSIFNKNTITELEKVKNTNVIVNLYKTYYSLHFILMVYIVIPL